VVVVDIAEVSQDDEQALKAFWEVDYASARFGHPHAAAQSWHSFRNVSLEPSDYYGHILLAAYDADRTVGVCDIGLSFQDNLHMASVDIGVLPEFRRQGIASQLYGVGEARCRELNRMTLVGETHVNPEESSGLSFAERLGFSSAQQEHHLYCPLPTTTHAVPGESSEYEVLTWTARCPDAYAAEYCAMRTQMANDVPIGEIDYQPVTFDEARLRAIEDRVARGYVQLVAAARRRTDGIFAGYSILLVDPTTTDALQDDTLVMPEHRGRRLGLRLKHATLGVLQHDFPDRTGIHTWTAVDNEAMLATNRAFGFEEVEIAHGLQKKLS